MNLTPIKVRGKKRSKATARHRAALVERRAAAAAAATDTTAKTREIHTRKRQLPRKKSLLERQLPLEILERIFLLSENAAFPRCSPLLGRLLSGHTTLLAALIAAFGPTWNAYFGVNQHQVQTFRGPGAAFQREGHHLAASLYPGNPQFQSDILACPWATIDLILEAKQTWARRFARDRWYAHDPSVLEESRARGTHNVAGGRGHFDASTCFAYDFDNMRRGVDPPMRQPASPTLRHRFVTYVDVHPDIRIPDDLVAGPWTPEMIRRLFWLRRGGATFHESQTWELRLQGLRNGIIECPPRNHSPHLIRSLCLLSDFFCDEDEDEGLSETELRRDAPVTQLSWPKTIIAEAYDKVADIAEKGAIYEVHELLRHMDHVLNLV
ncbi:hypothetical protein SODALDRAFT_382338 [Sodiomyces alkalinus F11]|uniref:Uncharacterized protein n=1 Tax=Sodiomyces alkalinus (strain CBS 110278 / VKM F-3762 / F11) TaxID=1314773 RepID=A0A3N2PJR0_SODAK|nr:hypothetical protein SODALDRAFT_382338 [Sodiomyces alkalinus F11]ROT34768.1 hypothetical protein SODALDRAFT_382338 [Sodiomyces alkalinus F11]